MQFRSRRPANPWYTWSLFYRFRMVNNHVFLNSDVSSLFEFHSVKSFLNPRLDFGPHVCTAQVFRTNWWWVESRARSQVCTQCCTMGQHNGLQSLSLETESLQTSLRCRKSKGFCASKLSVMIEQDWLLIHDTLCGGRHSRGPEWTHWSYIGMVTGQWVGAGPHGQTLHCQCVNKTNIHLGVYLHSRQLHIPHFIPSSHLPCSSQHWHTESSETLRMLHLRHSRWNNLALFPTSLSTVMSLILFSAL